MEASVTVLAAQYGIDHAHRIVLYAGTFEPYQGLDLLVDASPIVVHACTNVRFLCLGGNRNQVATIKTRAHQLGVSESFILPGTIPPEDVEQHFKIASVLVSPRILGTNTPLKIYSYLRSRIPIVATNIRSHTQVLTPNVALLVEPQPESLAAGILRVLNDSQLSGRLVENALQLAQESYSSETYHSKIAEVFSFLSARSQVGS
jgi:glycosyltransferase involved in cell wall biosynthesis